MGAIFPRRRASWLSIRFAINHRLETNWNRRLHVIRIAEILLDMNYNILFIMFRV